MTDDETVQVSHRVPKAHRDAAQNHTERGRLSEAVRAVYAAYAHGTDPTAEIERSALERQHERLCNHRDATDDRIADLEDRIGLIMERRKGASDRIEQYEDVLSRVENDVRDGMNVFPDHGVIQRAATHGDTTPTDVIAELQDRNPDLPDHAFVAANQTDVCWNGTSNER